MQHRNTFSYQNCWFMFILHDCFSNMSLKSHVQIVSSTSRIIFVTMTESTRGVYLSDNWLHEKRDDLEINGYQLARPRLCRMCLSKLYSTRVSPMMDKHGLGNWELVLAQFLSAFARRNISIDRQFNFFVPVLWTFVIDSDNRSPLVTFREISWNSLQNALGEENLLQFSTVHWYSDR